MLHLLQSHHHVAGRSHVYLAIGLLVHLHLAEVFGCVEARAQRSLRLRLIDHVELLTRRLMVFVYALLYSGRRALLLLLLLLLFVVVFMNGCFLTVDLHLEARPLKFVLGVEHALLQVAHLLLLTLGLADAERGDALALLARHHR